MIHRGPPTERLIVFTDAVFAVIITIMVLDLKPPADSKLSALLALWPTVAQSTFELNSFTRAPRERGDIVNCLSLCA